MKKTISTTREYAEMMYHLHKQGTGNKVGELLYGRIHTKGDEFTEVDIVQSRKLKKDYKCSMGQCYYNAQKIMIGNPMQFHYYEGWVGRIIPIEHGWLVDRSTSLVVDPTLTKLKKKGDYFGITVPKTLINKTWNEEQVARQLIWEYLLAKVNSNGTR